MASGAPAPGGRHVIAPGGRHMAAPGGMNLNEHYDRALLAGYPDFDISPYGDSSGARVAQSRSVANLRLGRAGGAVTYNWTLPTKPGGSVATVSGGTTATGSFTPDVAGTYVFQVAVTYSDSTVVTKSVSYTSA